MKNGRYRLPIIAAVFMVLGANVALAERLSVSASTANIRSGPGTNHEVLWQVQKYFPILVLQKSGPWYNFRDFEGDEGWIHQSLVQATPSVITIKEKCNVRSGPGTQNRILFSVGKGIPFREIKKEDSWLHIEHADGDQGWIHKSLVW